MIESDILYLRNQLFLELNEKKAEKNLNEEIDKSINCTYRRVDVSFVMCSLYFLFVKFMHRLV